MRKLDFSARVPSLPMIPNRPEEGRADELREHRKKAAGRKKKEKPEVEPAWADSPQK